MSGTAPAPITGRDGRPYDPEDVTTWDEWDADWPVDDDGQPLPVSEAGYVEQAAGCEPDAGPVFYMGTHETSWLARTSWPLFIARGRLARRVNLPRALGPWALDSGGFGEIQRHGRWTITAEAYADEVARYAAEVGHLDWCAPQDWMCEPDQLAITGKSVEEHQELTVANYLELADLLRPTGVTVIPVLQGWELDDYVACMDLYTDAGVDLFSPRRNCMAGVETARPPLVGVGSVCRRQATDDIGAIFATLAGFGLRLHGFGVKLAGVERYGQHLASADSLSWSVNGRNRPDPEHDHANCANCFAYAVEWRHRVVERIPA